MLPFEEVYENCVSSSAMDWKMKDLSSMNKHSSEDQKKGTTTVRCPPWNFLNSLTIDLTKISREQMPLICDEKPARRIE